MPSMYRLTKWYCDVLTPDHGYAFLYFATVRIGPLSMHSLTVHVAQHDSDTVTHSIRIPRGSKIAETGESLLVQMPHGHVRSGAGSLDINCGEPGCSVQLHYEPCDSRIIRPVVIGSRTGRHILWKPLALSYRVTGSLVVGDVTIDAGGTEGYADYLESTFIPPLVPVRTLYWGRMISGDLRCVFMHASNGSKRKKWSRMICGVGADLSEFDDVAVDMAGSERVARDEQLQPLQYTLRAVNAAENIALTVRHERPVQEGGFIDQQEIHSRFLNSLLKTITRDPRSTKYFSSADVSCALNRGAITMHRIPMIDEYALL